jgi:hypothetical protein
MLWIDQVRVVDDDEVEAMVVMAYLPSRWDVGNEATGPTWMRSPT